MSTSRIFNYVTGVIEAIGSLHMGWFNLIQALYAVRMP